MSPLGPTSPPASGAIAAAGSLATGAAERTAKLEAAAGHSLAAGRRDLAPQRLSGDPNASADRDADGWTGHASDDGSRPESSAAGQESPPEPERLRLPDDPRGGTLDVTA